MPAKGVDPKKLTIRDIAEEAGLSISTVSRVLNGKAEEYRIGAESQKRVREVARKLNYVPNQFAANLKSGKSNTIALIVPSLHNPFFAEIASRINSEIRKRGYITIIEDTNENPEIEKKDLKQLISRNIEGLIIVPCGNQWQPIHELYQQGMPVVCIDRYYENLDIPYVSTDNYEGAFLAARHFLDCGHRSIACIQGVRESNTNKLRVQGFRDALQAAGIRDPKIVGSDFTTKNGYQETKRLLLERETPTAIFALSNTIAMGSMKALRESGLRIPEDISLITFDDHPYLDFLATPLSCISQPIKQISKLAVQSLFATLKNTDHKPEHILLKPEIRIRNSVRNLKD